MVLSIPREGSTSSILMCLETTIYEATGNVALILAAGSPLVVLDHLLEYRHPVKRQNIFQMMNDG